MKKLYVIGKYVSGMYDMDENDMIILTERVKEGKGRVLKEIGRQPLDEFIEKVGDLETIKTIIQEFDEETGNWKVVRRVLTGHDHFKLLKLENKEKSMRQQIVIISEKLAQNISEQGELRKLIKTTV